MVVQVTGKADEFELIFNKSKQGLWTTTVPSALNGEYILELFAKDDAGNITYITKVLFVVNRITMEAKLVPLEYSAVLEEEFKSIGIRRR